MYRALFKTVHCPLQCTNRAFTCHVSVCFLITLCTMRGDTMKPQHDNSNETEFAISLFLRILLACGMPPAGGSLADLDKTSESATYDQRVTELLIGMYQTRWWYDIDSALHDKAVSYDKYRLMTRVWRLKRIRWLRRYYKWLRAHGPTCPRLNVRINSRVLWCNNVLEVEGRRTRRKQAPGGLERFYER
jgi:hypothetical protein